MVILDRAIISTKIKQIREEKRINQRQLAKLIDVAPQTVSYWEMAKTLPTPAHIKKLADFGEKTVLWLITK